MLVGRLSLNVQRARTMIVPSTPGAGPPPAPPRRPANGRATRPASSSALLCQEVCLLSAAPLSAANGTPLPLGTGTGRAPFTHVRCVENSMAMRSSRRMRCTRSLPRSRQLVDCIAARMQAVRSDFMIIMKPPIQP